MFLSLQRRGTEMIKPLVHDGLFYLLGIVASVFAISNASSAQTQPSAAEVTVTARKPTLDVYIKEIRTLSETDSGQITRFEDAVCPQVAGLSGSMAAAVEALIRKNATRVGARVAQEPCEPNWSSS